MSSAIPDPSKWGIAPSYVDQTGEVKRSPHSTIERVLQAMGADAQEPGSDGPLVVEPGQRIARIRELELEDGTSLSISNETLPMDLPFGYHTAHFADGSSRLTIASPGRCVPVVEPTWGWALQLYALRSKRSWGIGDFADLERFGRWTRGLGAGVAMINPLHAPAPGTPQHPSPYNPATRLFLNPLFIDVGALSSVSRFSAVARRGRRLNKREVIARDEAYELKLSALTSEFARFQGDERFDAFVQNEPHLLQYATFLALQERYGTTFALWPEEYRRPTDPAIRGFQDENADAVRFNCFVQWIATEQLSRAGAAVGLIADLAIGFDAGGFDAWLWQGAIASGFGIGAPADDFNTKGQAWGLPPFDPWKLRAADYEPFISTLRAAFRYCAGIRLDHVMGLFRQFWIPEGAEAAEGAYVRYPADDLLAILALESHRAGAFVIGEDLGTVEGGVREEMAAREVLGYRVMWFEPGDPSEYPEKTVAVVTNHDLPTIVGLWSEDDLLEQIAIGLDANVDGTKELQERIHEWANLSEDPALEDVVTALYERVGRARSQVVLVTVDDAMMARRRPNIPGTSDERPNWSIPLPMTLEQLERGRLAREIAHLLSRRRG